jgi:ADP-ribosylglycohydrolase
MIGAVAGDIIGSVYEYCPAKSMNFDLFTSRSKFTDDTVLTVAIADSILNKKDYASTVKEYGRRYQNAGYGKMFRSWLLSDRLEPYNSFGNGSAMRVSPVGFAFDTIEEVLSEAKKSAEITHNHPEGIKGAQATAAAVFLARQGKDKPSIKTYIENKFGYDLSRSLSDIKKTYDFDETCQGTVPQAIIAFLESNDYEDAIRKAVFLGGGSDTLACITGGIAQAYYGDMPEQLLNEAKRRLAPDLLAVVGAFGAKYNGIDKDNIV